MHIFVWLSIVMWFVVIPFTSSTVVYPTLSNYIGVAFKVLEQPGFWFYVPLACAMALFPVIVVRSLTREFFPTLVDDIILKGKLKMVQTEKHLTRKGSQRQSGYAFSHQEGFGQFITSGRGFGIPEEQVEAERNNRLSKVPHTEAKDSQAPPPGDVNDNSELHPQPSNAREAKEGEGAEKSGPHSQRTAVVPNIPGTPIHVASSQDTVLC